MTIYLSVMLGSYSAKAYVGVIQEHYMVEQTLIVTPQALDHCEITDLDRRAVALVW